MSETVVRERCPRCEGCGLIANSEEGEPWRVWEALPLASALAVRLGIVKPIVCPDCAGTGRRREPECPELFYEQDGDRWLEFWCIEPLPHRAHRLKRTGRVVDSVPEGGVVLEWEQRPTWQTAPE